MSELGAGASPARPGGLAQALTEQFSVEATIGGPRGLVESVLPMTLFSVAYGLGTGMRTAIIAAIAPAAAFALWRLVAREPLSQAISGVVGVAIGAVLALRTGRPENMFMPSLVKNSAQLIGFSVSSLVRWPLVGLVLGVMLGEQLHWRQVPARARAYRQITWVWAGMAGLRLGVQIPLYLAGAVATLGMANIVLGLPLFAAVLWVTWAIHRRVPVAYPPVPERDEPAERCDEAVAPVVRPDASPG